MEIYQAAGQGATAFRVEQAITGHKLWRGDLLLFLPDLPIAERAVLVRTMPGIGAADLERWLKCYTARPIDCDAEEAHRRLVASLVADLQPARAA